MAAPQMREAPRRGSGVYDQEEIPHGSQASLAGRAEPQAGFVGYDTRDIGAAPPAPPRTPWYKTRKFIICQIITAILVIVLLFVLLFPVVRAIAQLIINRSKIGITVAQITNAANGSFTLHTEGRVNHTGIFSATIKFPTPVQVLWTPPNGTQQQLGTLPLNPLKASHSRAELNQNTTFTITNQTLFGEFTQTLITQKSFTWILKSDDVVVNALKFPTAKGLHFNQELTIPAINNFNGAVKLLDFQLPHDANSPDGGIDFVATTGLNNPSPFNVDLGTATFNLSYAQSEGAPLFLGQGMSNNTKIAPGDNTITLSGRLIPHQSQADLAALGKLFSNYLNSDPNTVVIASGVSTRQPDGEAISWLSQGLTALHLSVPFVPAEPINPIREIDIGSLNLTFTPETAWTPLTSSNSVLATLKLPFGFSVNISQIANSFAIVQNNAIIANLSTSPGQSTSDINVLGPTDTEGSINITLNSNPLQIPADGHDRFAAFNRDLTNSTETVFSLVGHADANSSLSIGPITLDPIQFSVTSRLKGLGGLRGATTIDSVDVTGGTTDHINLNIGVTIQNPSSLNLDTGDLVLQLSRDGAVVGTTLLPNLSLVVGKNVLAATSDFTPNLSPQGIQTLNDFVGGKDVELVISGFSGSTQVPSLLPAFESLNMTATLPGLNASLLNTASLEILPSTGQNNIAHVTVALKNPFSGGLTITGINSTVTSHGLNLGTINTKTNFPAAGRSTTESPTLDLDMNLDPSTIFTLLRRLAVDSGENTAQVDEIVKLGGINYMDSTDADGPGSPPSTKRQAALFKGFDLPSFVDRAFSQLKSDIDLISEVSIGDYPTTLSFSQRAVPVKTDASLHMLLPTLAQPIVQKLITGSELGIDTVVITNPQQNTFQTQLKGSITNAGPFDAEIEFGEGLTISFSGQPLGKIMLPKVQVAGDVGAKLDVTASFQVADVDRLTSFTKTLLTEESFNWDITGDNLTVNALGISIPGVTLTTKSVQLKGMNGLKGGVKIDSFDLPSNDPAGGIHLTLQTTVTNPSQVGIALDSIVFDNFVGSTRLGPAASSSSFTLAPLSTFKLPLVGRLIPQDSNQGLATVSQVFTDFIHGKDTQVNVVGASAGPSDVTWLNDAIKTLQIATVLPARGSLTVINSISLDQLELDFTSATAYSPLTSSKAATAAFQIPFGFPIDIVALEQNITTSVGGQSFATLSIPKGPAKTDVDARIIHLTFSNVPFSVFGDKHSVFQQFLADTTTAKSETFQLSGAANTDASTAVGLLTLTDIGFNVQTSLAGLQGLNAKPTVVSNLDVNHGFPDFLLIKVSTSLNNPSNITIGTGDVAFGLTFNDQTIGTAQISNLTITPGDGNYSTDVHFQPQGDALAAGQTLLENFLQGINSDTVIVGTSQTTTVDSLIPALESIKLTASIPPLHQNLITATHIVFPSNIIQTGVAGATVDLSNPFTASINLLVLSATATFENLTLGTVPRVDATADPIHASGHSNVTTRSLPLQFNLDPLTIIELLTIRAAQKHIDIGPLSDLFQIVMANPNFHPPITTSVDTGAPACVSGKQFDVDGAILNALDGLEVTLDVQSTVKLDDFQTDLAFKQFNVPAVTDQTALFLIGAVSPPIVQTLVNQATLSFDVANITNITNEGFDLSLHGQLVDTGPLDAQITFVEPVNVNWQGKDIATITLPPVCAAANVGVPDYQTMGHLTITHLDDFTDFATFLLHNPSFDWTISTNKLRLTALGTIFDNVSLSKKVTFKAFNNLPGVTISNFQLPRDDPAGGISISTDSLIPSSAQLGIQLGTVTFESFFKNVDVGPLTGSNLFLAASTTTLSHLTGRITPKNDNDLDTIGELFSDFLAGKNQTLSIQGSSVDPNGNGQLVSWLSTAFKTLTLEVTLPGHTFEIIHSINIEDLKIELTETSQDFNPLTSSNVTHVVFSNPFGFSLQVIEAGQNLTIGFNGVDAAALNLPLAPAISGVSTGNNADLTLSFQEETLHSLNNDAFASFFAQTTDKESANVELKGAANILAKTAIGNVPISGIPFGVDSVIPGIDSFGGKADLTNVTIVGSGGDGGNQFIRSPLTTTLQNPSNISLTTTDVSLPVVFQGVELGRAVINDFHLVPGENIAPSEFHYQPGDPNDTIAQNFLEQFLISTDTLDLTITGDSASSEFNSLIPALEGVSLSASLQGQGFTIITHVHVIIDLVESLATNIVNVDFDVFNPTDADLVIQFVQSEASMDGTVFAVFSHDFGSNPFVVPAGQSANSGLIGDVFLPQTALASLGIIGQPLDIDARQTVLVGQGGYQVPWLGISQKGVPSSADLVLTGLPIPPGSGIGATAPSSPGLLGSIISSPNVIPGMLSSAAASLSKANATATAESGSVTTDSTAKTTSQVSSSQNQEGTTAAPESTTAVTQASKTTSQVSSSQSQEGTTVAPESTTAVVQASKAAPDVSTTTPSDDVASPSVTAVSNAPSDTQST